ncbi:ABC transporter ATP-binding protein [Streptococcus pyogenes]|uniref:ABC transporter ATP-binding protein n=1 Tax=Streptococcus pyogenes TaxID=1314 RepID=UPI003204990F
MFLSICATSIFIWVPFIFKDFLDKIINKSNFDIQNIILGLLLVLIYLFCQIISQYLLKIVGIDIVSSIRTKVISKLLKLEKQFFDNHSSGDLGSLLTNDTSLISNLITTNIPELITAVFSITLVLISLFLLSNVLSIVLLVLIPLILLIFIPLGNILSKLSFQNQTYLGKLNQFANFITINSDFIKDNTTQKHEKEKGQFLITYLKTTSRKQAKYISIITPILSFLLMLTILIVLTVGIYLISIKNLTIGSLVAYLLLTLEVLNPVTSLGSNLTALKILKGATSRLNSLFEDKQIEYLENTASTPFIEFDNLVLQNVTFSYPFSNQFSVVQNISFSINCGESVAIVGPSGSGKSTLMNLITCKYKNYLGNIYLNNKNIQDYGLQELRSSISYVSQNNVLFTGTLKENILYGIDRDISDSEIISVSKLANFDDVIAKLSNGLLFKINAGESNLSEGEKQRLAITRALLKNSSLLLLDEVTSALDAESEQKVIDTLHKASKQKGILLIAHRLSTVKKVNKIIFLENGNITGIGSHSELFSSHPRYKKYVLTQLTNQ